MRPVKVNIINVFSKQTHSSNTARRWKDMLTKQVNGGELNIAGTDHLAQSLYRELETFTKIKLNKNPCSDTGGNWF